MATKPFKTIEEQIGILRRRGMMVDDSAAQVLMREGYYSIVNGYKAPFIDRHRTLECGEDRYKDGTRFDDMLRLFEFDRALRELTFHSLIKAEISSSNLLRATKKPQVIGYAGGLFSCVEQTCAKLCQHERSLICRLNARICRKGPLPGKLPGRGPLSCLFAFRD